MAVKPKLALIPSGVGVDKLYSVLPSDGTGDFTFDRNLNTATRINKDGLIEMVDADVPRLNYPLIDGVVSGCPSLLLEPESRNLITYSEDFNNPSWNKSNTGTGVLPIVNTNQIISPDGTLSADELIFNSGGGTTTSDRSVLDILFTVNTGNDYTGSIWLKGKNNGDQILLGQLSGGYELITLTTEWVRYEFTQAASTSPRHFNIGIRQNIFGIINDTVEVYAWGAQLEEQSYATSYIPTSGSQATRSAETCTGAGDANTFNDSEGVLMAEIAKNKGNQYSLISLFKSSVSDTYIYMGYLNNTTTIRGQIKVGGTTVLDEEIEMADTNITAKVSVRYKSGDYSLYVNGLEVGSSSSTAIFTDGDLNELQFGFANNSIFDFYGNTKQLQYFDTALSDEELALLTKI